jgi:hypothetical protein
MTLIELFWLYLGGCCSGDVEGEELRIKKSRVKNQEEKH